MFMTQPLHIRLISFLIVCALFFVSANAQENEDLYLDSLRKIAFKKVPDSNSLNSLDKISRHYFYNGQYDSALKYTRLALPIAKLLGNNLKLGKSYSFAGLHFTNLNKYDSGKYYFDKAYEIATQEGDTSLMVSTLNGLAVLYNYQGNYNKSTEYLLQQVKIIESSSNPSFKQFIVQAYGNIGHNLIDEKQFEKGISYIEKALLLKNYSSEDRFRTSMHLDIFFAYLTLKNYENAKIHLDSAFLYNQKLNNIEISMLVLNNAGLYYKAIENHSKAAAYLHQAKEICDDTDNDYMKSEICSNLGSIYLKLKKYEMAESYSKQANTIARKIHKLDIIAESYNTLKEIAEATGNYKTAYSYATLYKNYSDSVTNEKSQKEILNLEARFESEKKEKEIADLKLANADNELAVIKRNRLLLILGITAAAVLSIISLLYRNSRQKHIISEKDKILKDEQIKFLERQQQIVSLQSMINGQETERSRIAKDLHDGLGGLFSTIKMHFSTLAHEKEELRENPVFTKSYELINSASEEVRRIAHNMMPEVLIKLGLLQAIKDLGNSISAGKLLYISVQAYEMDKRLNAPTEIMLFRIIQELLNNIIKHANATEAIIQFNRQDNRLNITVEDNGKGFSPHQTEGSIHAGLSSVESRVEYLNGKFTIDSQKEIGTTIMMSFLLKEES